MVAGWLDCTSLAANAYFGCACARCVTGCVGIVGQTRKDSISKRVLDDFTADRKFDRDQFYFSAADLEADQAEGEEEQAATQAERHRQQGGERGTPAVGTTATAAADARLDASSDNDLSAADAANASFVAFAAGIDADADAAAMPGADHAAGGATQTQDGGSECVRQDVLICEMMVAQ